MRLKRQEKEDQQKRLFALFDAFQKNVLSNLKLKESADAFAQMFVYGLFFTKPENKEVTLKNKRFNEYSLCV